MQLFVKQNMLTLCSLLVSAENMWTKISCCWFDSSQKNQLEYFNLSNANQVVSGIFYDQV